jgi:hypothetical protein
MQLRYHPLISYRGLPSWPPAWTPANPKSHLKVLRGEIGRLEYVLPNKTSVRFLLFVNVSSLLLKLLLFRSYSGPPIENTLPPQSDRRILTRTIPRTITR